MILQNKGNYNCFCHNSGKKKKTFVGIAKKVERSEQKEPMVL